MEDPSANPAKFVEWMLNEYRKAGWSTEQADQDILRMYDDCENLVPLSGKDGASGR